MMGTTLIKEMWASLKKDQLIILMLTVELETSIITIVTWPEVKISKTSWTMTVFLREAPKIINSFCNLCPKEVIEEMNQVLLEIGWTTTKVLMGWIKSLFHTWQAIIKINSRSSAMVLILLCDRAPIDSQLKICLALNMAPISPPNKIFLIILSIEITNTLATLISTITPTSTIARTQVLFYRSSKWIAKTIFTLSISNTKTNTLQLAPHLTDMMRTKMT